MLKTARIRIPARGLRTLKLKPRSIGAARKIVKLVRQVARATAKVKVRATDAAGNTNTAKRTIRLY